MEKIPFEKLKPSEQKVKLQAEAFRRFGDLNRWPELIDGDVTVKKSSLNSKINRLDQKLVKSKNRNEGKLTFFQVLAGLDLCSGKEPTKEEIRAARKIPPDEAKAIFFEASKLLDEERRSINECE